MRHLVLSALVFMGMGCGASSTRVRSLEDAHAFEHLSAIEGAWQLAEGETQVDYTRISRGSALVENWVSGNGTRTLTVYHPDHARVLLTHYCAQGNQARLALVEATETSFRFEREDATNVLPDQAVLTTLVLSLEGNALVRTEVYVDAEGVAEEGVMRFLRVTP